jgi:hypothetical protein
VRVRAPASGYPELVTTDRSTVRATAAQGVRDALGIEPTAEALFERLSRQVGPHEVDLVVAAVRRTPVDRRKYALACVAAASLAMDYLGAGWWHEARSRNGVSGAPADNRSPATLLRSEPEIGSTLTVSGLPWPAAELLGLWAEDDVADHLWGAPVDYVDLNSSQPVDRVPAPENSRPGDRILLAWDPGCRIEAVVEERGVGKLGTMLDGELRFSPTADLWWNWATATELEQHQLPGEPPAAPTP